MSERLRHPDKDIEKYLLVEAERRGCRVTKGKKYYRIKCPCGAHMATVHLSPSNPNYLKNRLNDIQKWECWEKR